MSDERVVGCDDAEIVVKLRARNEDGLRLLLRNHGGKVKGWMRKHYAAVLTEQEREGALNQATFNVWQHAHSYDDQKATLGAWFLRIAQNAAIDIIRQEERNRHSAFLCEPAYDPYEGNIDGGTGPGNGQQRLLTDLDAEIHELPPHQQRIIRADLAAAGGTADSGRLSELFGIPKTHVFVYRSKARRRLRVEMQNRGHFRKLQRTGT